MDSENNNQQLQQAPQEPIPPTPVTPPITGTPYDNPIPPQKPANRKKKLIIIGVAVTILVIIIAVVAWLVFFKKGTDTQQSQTTPPSTSNPTESNNTNFPDLSKFLKTTTGETWYSEPKAVAKQGWYQPSVEESVEYYEVGKRGQDTIYMTARNEIGDVIDLFEKSADGKVRFILRPDNQATYNETGEVENEKNTRQYIVVSSVELDKTISYDSLSIPQELEIENGYKLTRQSYPLLGERLSNDNTLEPANRPNRQTVKELGTSKIFKTEKSYVDTKLTSIGYGIITPLKNFVSLDYEPIDTDAAAYKWTSGESVIDGKYYPITRGCGGSKTSATRGDTIKDSDVVQTGTTKAGLPIYEFKDINYITATKAYDEFKEFAGGYTNVPYYNISKEDFFKRHSLIVHKDKFNQWLVFINDKMAPGAGCAKPVVYLYPTKTTEVSVKVGADVKISDPLYNPATGWKAIAQPNGQLTVDGNRYESLFWEGPGHGEYPAITSGTVVSKAQAIDTIRNQLAIQGLNAKESKDFIDYWGDKLPNKPYIRLTWFTTAELDRLAPLNVSPKPDTSIRVFLDMSGLDNQISIPQQTFTTPKRTGFTLVEWGGLANFKLY